MANIRGIGFYALSISGNFNKKRQGISWSFLFEATMGFEPMMRDLQTLALPLGDVARYKTLWLAINGSL